MDTYTAKRWGMVARYNYWFNPDTRTMPYGKITEIAKEFSVSNQTLMRAVNDYFLAANNNELVPDLSKNITEALGAPSKRTPEVEMEIKAYNSGRSGRTTIRNIATNTGLAKSTLSRYLDEMESKVITMRLKPKLTENHKLRRLEFVLNKIRPNGSLFKSFRNQVHIDESWFFLNTNGEFVRVFPGEETPEWLAVQHKSHIRKVMFLTVLALPRPEFDFDGKIGIWRVCEEVIASRKSKLHNRGDVYEQDCTVTSEWYRDCMVGDDGILATICKKMPWMERRCLYVQHDGAPGHNGKGNLQAFEDYISTIDFNLKMDTQPAQSPDLNINDLGFYNSLKSRVNLTKDTGGSLQNMIDTVYEEFDSYDAKTLTRLWANLVENYRQIIEHLGGNAYKNPHSGISVRERAGENVIDYAVHEGNFAIAYDHMNA